MDRIEIINSVGSEFLVSNIENGEFSYAKGLKEIGKEYTDYLKIGSRRNYKDIDLRFVDGNLTVLIETKQKITKGSLKNDMEQLQNYVLFEKQLSGNKVIAILAATNNDKIMVWQDGSDIISLEKVDKEEIIIKPMSLYKNTHFGTRNDKLAIVQNTYQLNELLHNYGINEKIRSQFVGTCLLSIKNGLVYSLPIDSSENGKVIRKEMITTGQIRRGIEDVLTNLLSKDLKKAEKLVILKNKVIESQDVRDLKVSEFQHLLREIEQNILPYINDESTMGQDLLNLFFTTFNKYVGKSDKNQAFTPDHIVHFMCNVVGINRNSVVLDPCCGSGAFLVRAMTEAMADCNTPEEIEQIKENQIHGFEFEETAFGLATTNMLIHGDGNSNIVYGNCFDEIEKLDANINVTLMNPPYNAQRKHCKKDYVKTWSAKTKEDPSKGFHFVYEIAKKVKTGKLAVLLPMQCAIGTTGDIKYYKEKMLEEHTLDAVFSLPSDMFHPGAGASACCMIFDLGTRHENSTSGGTFFGYYKDDGFEKRKNLGRVEKSDGIWRQTEEKWLDYYYKRVDVTGFSVVRDITSEDEWLAEAYMVTDYSKLDNSNFQDVLNNYVGHMVTTGKINVNEIINTRLDEINKAEETKTKLNKKNEPSASKSLKLKIDSWEWFNLTGKDGIFEIENCKCSNASSILVDGDDVDYIGAKKTNQGVMKRVVYDEDYITKGKGIIFICDGQGSVGYSNYIEDDFIGSTTISIGRNSNLNNLSGLFIVALLDLERFKYSFGRKYRNSFSSAKIKLPSKVSKDGSKHPDWKFMENFMKNLTNAELLL